MELAILVLILLMIDANVIQLSIDAFDCPI